MTPTRVAPILAVAAALAVLGCRSEPGNSHAQGHPEAVPRQPILPAQTPQSAQTPEPMAGQEDPGQGTGRLDGPQPEAVSGAKKPGGLVPWAELARALPPAGQGWVPQGQAEGETLREAFPPSSTARIRLAQGAMLASVEISDNRLAADFAAKRLAKLPDRTGPATSFSRVTVRERAGLCTFHGDEKRAEVLMVVDDRLVVKIDVRNTPNDGPAFQLAHQVDYKLLQWLIGG